ncbi:helix-turn-helix domain-containing protein [Streptomyces griseus]|uniref:helix-turn-helix domain-containing protein n=1 Tax=Streptomyces griseus TaxID=1911 RepID=UPI0018FEA483|nr:helix-turn-helix domain-containing protein [Streptomyces griseus]
MSEYVIVITPTGSDGEPDLTGPQTTVRVDTTDGPRIVELTVRAAGGSGLHNRTLPTVDFDLLVRAISPGTTAPPADSVAPAPVSLAPLPAAVPAAPGEERPRPYRKMPDTDVVVRVYEELGGSVGAVAKRFGVPRHTAQAWVSRLRKQGHID